MCNRKRSQARTRAVEAGAQAGVTKVSQEVSLDKKVSSLPLVPRDRVSRFGFWVAWSYGGRITIRGLGFTARVRA